jgi:hypothetical protein
VRWELGGTIYLNKSNRLQSKSHSRPRSRGGFFISDRGFIGTARLHDMNNVFLLKENIPWPVLSFNRVRPTSVTRFL